MTLTDFLLARITEDEERDPEYGFFINRELHDVDCMEFGAVERSDAKCDCDGPKRWAAECEAKRRIVEWHDATEDCCDERYGPLVLDAEPELSAGVDALGRLTIRESIGTEPYLGCVTLMLLALPYADHPDYRDDWRP